MDGKNVSEVLQDQLDAVQNLAIRGKTVSEWHSHFYITINADANIFEIKSVLSRLNELYHELGSVLSEIKLLLDSTASMNKVETANQIESILNTERTAGNKISREEAKRRVANDMSRRRKLIGLMEAEYVFFKTIEDRLRMTYNIINTMNIAEGYIQKLERTGGNI